MHDDDFFLAASENGHQTYINNRVTMEDLYIVRFKTETSSHATHCMRTIWNAKTPFLFTSDFVHGNKLKLLIVLNVNTANVRRAKNIF